MSLATIETPNNSARDLPPDRRGAPYPTIQQAVDAASAGTIVAIAAGTYVEDVAIDGTPVALWGRCPELVEIVGSANDRAVGSWSAPGAEVHQVAVTGPQLGIEVVELQAADPGFEEERLLRAVQAWLSAEWPFTKVRYPGRD